MTPSAVLLAIALFVALELALYGGLTLALVLSGAIENRNSYWWIKLSGLGLALIIWLLPIYILSSLGMLPI